MKLSVSEWLARIPIKIEHREEIETKFALEYGDDEETTSLLRDACIDFLDQLMPLLNPYLLVEEEQSEDVINPTNVPAEDQFIYFNIYVY